MSESGNFFLQRTWNETIHNYISDDNIVRKGAIRAEKDEYVLIPINMRDGCIIGRGKGNGDWNKSAPHGAGRIMSRNEARTKLSLDKYQESMSGIFTTSVCSETIDEAPMVYKPMQEIIDNVKDTIDIVEIMQEGCRAEKVPMSVKFINTNDKAIECLKKISRYATECGNDDYFHYDAFQTYIQYLIKELGGKDE